MTAASGKEWVPKGNYARRPVVAFIEHIHDEFIHHAAEIALLRDLFRARFH